MQPARLCAALIIIVTSAHAQPQPPGHITGIGGIFIKSPDKKALAAWYKDVMQLPIQPWGGAILSNTAPDHPPVATWNAFKTTTTYFAPSTRDVMIDFSVDNLDAVIARLKQHNVAILKQDSSPEGKFAWIMDPDGTKIELWQPAPAQK